MRAPRGRWRCRRSGVSRQPSTVRPFFAHDAFDNALALQALLAFHRQENHAHAVFARRRQREAEARAFAREKLVRNLDQDARAVARFRIAAAGAAVRQVDENLNALLDDVVGFWPLMLATKPIPQASCSWLGVIETLGLGQAGYVSPGGVLMADDLSRGVSNISRN